MILSAPMSAMRSGYGDEMSLVLMARAGFDAIDYTFNEMTEQGNVWNQPSWKSYATRLKAKAEELHVYFNQGHAPFVFHWEDRSEWDKWIIPTVEHSFECASALGIPIIVVHPIHHFRYKGNESYLWDLNLDYYRTLIPFARKAGVKIALENMLQYDEKRGCIVPDVFARPEKYLAFYDTLASEEVVACVDVGHSGPTGEDPVELLTVLGDRVKALHVHDNCFRHDDHYLPFLGMMDWDAITGALASIHYQGDFTFEVTNFLKKFFRPRLIEAALEFEEQVGRYLIGQIEEKMRSLK